MKKQEKKIKIIKVNKKTNQAIVTIPLDIYADLAELVDSETVDQEIALKRSLDPKQELISKNELKKELGL